MYAGTALKDENKRDHKKVIIQIATCYMRLANNKCQSYAAVMRTLEIKDVILMSTSKQANRLIHEKSTCCNMHTILWTALVKSLVKAKAEDKPVFLPSAIPPTGAMSAIYTKRQCCNIKRSVPTIRLQNLQRSQSSHSLYR